MISFQKGANRAASNLFFPKAWIRHKNLTAWRCQNAEWLNKWWNTNYFIWQGDTISNRSWIATPIVQYQALLNPISFMTIYRIKSFGWQGRKKAHKFYEQESLLIFLKFSTLPDDGIWDESSMENFSTILLYNMKSKFLWSTWRVVLLVAGN